MSQGLSVTLGTCLAAAGVAVGALFVAPDASVRTQSGDQQAGHQSTQPEPYGNSGTATPQAEESASGPELSIDDFALESVTVAAGATVTVVNNGSVPHTATAENGSFSTGTIAPGGSATFIAPTVPGTYPIFCVIHPSMTAAVTVS